MDSESAATTRGRCRVCLDSDVDVVALSLTVCVFAEEVTFSQLLTTCCGIEISASDLKPQIICKHCSKIAEQSYLFRKTCQNTDLILQEELDGVTIKIEPDESRYDQEEDDIKAESDELTIKEEDDQKNGMTADIKDDFPDFVSITNTNGFKQLQSKQNTSSTEENVCNICQTYFTDWISLEHHLENCYRRACYVTGQTFISSYSLVEHTQTQLLANTEKKVILKREKSKCHKCRFCEMSYKYPAELKNHLMTHTTVKHYLCSCCGYNFSLAHRSKCERTHALHSRKHIKHKSSDKALMSNKLINSSKTPHKCLQCSKEFEFGSQLKRHARTHTGEKPYECSHCRKRFLEQHALTKHKRTHTGEKPFECSHCSKRFCRKSDLTVHERIHTGESPYGCSHCCKRFKQHSNLKRHERMHTGEKP